MDCLSEEKLSAYAEGSLSSIERAIIRDHLILCPRCQKKSREFHRLEKELERPVLVPAPAKIRRSVMRQISSDVSYYSSLTALAAAAFVFVVTTLYLVFDFANNSIIRTFQKASVDSGGIVSAIIKAISTTFKWFYSLLNTANIFLKTLLQIDAGVELIAFFSLGFSLMLMFFIYTKLLRKGWKK